MKSYTLQEKFGIETLDWYNRDQAGLIIKNELFLNSSHNEAIIDYNHKFKTDMKLLIDKHAYLHLLNNNIFIDMNPVLTNIEINSVIKIIKEKLPNYKIWLYYYLKSIYEIN